MRHSVIRSFDYSVVALALCAAGCFNEPEPAYKTVPAETRVYLKASGLKVLTADDVYAKGKVFLAVEGENTEHGAQSQGSWTNLSARVKDFKPASLEYLNLDYNALTNADALTAFTGLKWLRLNSNRLAALPDLKGLSGLRRIYLKGNQFKEVPATLKDLPALTDVDLSGNPVKVVPEWLTAKRGLENVSLSDTQVERLPQDLSGWKGLTTLQLGGLRLTREEMSRIRGALPDVRIVF